MPKLRTLSLCLLLILPVACAQYKNAGYDSGSADAIIIPGVERKGLMESEDRHSQRHLFHTASLEVEVEAMDKAINNIEGMVNDLGGYIEQTNISEEFAVMKLRIPTESRLAGLDACRGLGEVLHESLQSFEVTDQVIDLQAQLNTQIALRGRLQTLLERAQNVSEVIMIEKEIQRLQASIDANQGRLDTILNRVAMTQIDLQLSRYIEPEEKPGRILGPVGMVLYAAGWLIEKAFVIRE